MHIMFCNIGCINQVGVVRVVTPGRLWFGVLGRSAQAVGCLCVGGSDVAATYIDFVVSGDPKIARATVERALAARQFRVTWQDEWTAVAERGSKGANFWLGTFAQYFKVGVSLTSAAPGQTILRIERQSSGLMGGAIGASRTRRNLSSLHDELRATFSAAGVLHGVSEA
jgi:hypothetical protein